MAAPRVTLGVARPVTELAKSPRELAKSVTELAKSRWELARSAQRRAEVPARNGKILAKQQLFEQRLLDVEAIPGFVEDHRVGTFDRHVVDLLAAMGGKAMEQQALRAGGVQHPLVDLDAPKGPPPFGGLGLLPHVGPDVGRDDIRAPCRILRMGMQREALA